MEIQARKLPVHNFSADVNVRRVMKTLETMSLSRATSLTWSDTLLMWFKITPIFQ